MRQVIKVKYVGGNGKLNTKQFRRVKNETIAINKGKENNARGLIIKISIMERRISL